MRFIKLNRSLVFVLLLPILFMTSIAHAQETTADKLAAMGGYPCPDSDFTCVKIVVPLNHFAVDKPLTTEVVFAVLPATGERKGMFVTATGGPGSSGLASADSYTAAFDPSIPEHFDIVFFDQRGIGQSGAIQCKEAVSTYYQAPTETDSPEHEAALITATKTFVDDCIKEMGISTDLLPFYGTKQVVEDLEVFRQAIGDEKIWLYGESYGTQYAQTYTAAHPDHVAGLILDGTVDLTLSGFEYYKQDTKAFNDTVVSTLDDCTSKPECAADVEGGDALVFYDEIAAELKTSPISFDFPLPSGETIPRQLTFTDLEYAAYSYVYSESTRMILQRALAAASQGNWIPLARVVYNAYVEDEETLVPLPDPTYSDALYYAVECNDYGYPGSTPEERAENYLRAGDATDSEIPHLQFIFYGDFPCAFWPVTTSPDRPAPLIAEGVPTLVLGATADPATPVGNGISVYKRLADGYLVTTQGGAHVIFGRGNECPDQLVTDFLVDDKMPDQRETTCDGVIATDYVSLPPVDASDFPDPLVALSSAYNEIYYLPEYYYWDYATPTEIGCTYGGSLGFTPTDEGNSFDLKDCAFTKGFAMTGTGTYSSDSGAFSLDVDVSGLHEGKLTYLYDADGNEHVTGTYNGETVDLPG